MGGLGELGQVIKADQIEALGVHKILLIWDLQATEEDRKQYETHQLSLLRGVQVKYINTEYEQLMEALKDDKKIDEPLKIFCEKVSNEIKKAVEND